MPDKKITDTEIKNNLEWLKTVGGDDYTSVTVTKEFVSSVYDLLNRYEAEIEQLRKSCSSIDMVCCENCTHLIKFKNDGFVAKCTMGHKEFLPFSWETDTKTYYCKQFTPAFTRK